MRLFFRGLLALLDILLLATFALAYAARYVRPDGTWWWLQLIAIGLPFLSVLVLAATVGVLIARVPGRAVHVLAVVLILVRFGWPFGGGERQPGDLTILTYNVPRYYGSLADSARAAQITLFVKRLDPDVVAVQEAGALTVGDTAVMYNPQIEGLSRALGYHVRWPYDKPFHSAQNNVMARFDVERTENLRLQLVPGQVYSELQRVYFHWQGRAAVLYSIHLRSYGRAKPWREGSARLSDVRAWRPYLRQYRDAILYRTVEADTLHALLARETVPVVVAGDFNSTPHNWVPRHVARGLGLQDAFLEAGTGWGGTYHTRLPLARIDFVMAGPEWRVAQARVPDVAFSDHKPLVVSLRWRDPPPADTTRADTTAAP